MSRLSMAMQTQTSAEDKPYYMKAEAIDRERLLVEAAQRDPARFEPLYERYHEPIFRYIDQRMSDRDLAFDVTSQVFLKALQNLHRYEFRGLPFGSWLFRIAKSELNKMFRAQKAQRSVNITDEHCNDLLEEMEESSLEPYRDVVIAKIAELPEQELQLVEMRFFEKRSFREMGEILELTEVNAKIKLYRTLKKLKRWITTKERAS